MGVNLAKAFADVLEDFGIADKVSKFVSSLKKKDLPRPPMDTLRHL
jgi:hypothetical protein